MKTKKVGLIILIAVVGFFAIVFATSYSYPILYPEEYERKKAIDEAIQNLEPFPFYESRTQEEWDYYNTEVNKILEEQNQQEPETRETTQMRELPDSCTGVGSTDVTLYPSAAQCMEDLALGFYDYCYADLQDKDLAQACASRGVLRVYENCEGSEDRMLSISEDVCVISEMKNAYLFLVYEN